MNDCLRTGLLLAIAGVLAACAPAPETAPPLVETDWLAANLEDPNLRIIDATVIVEPDGEGGMNIRSGRENWEQGHIPGSTFADLHGELKNPDNPLLPMPSEQQFADVMSRLGVGPGTRVVIYDGMMNTWAARIWWMLRYHGFDNASVLNGGWTKWKLEKRPVSTEPPIYPPAKFVIHRRPHLIVGKAEVLRAITNPEIGIVDSLPRSHYEGSGKSFYARPGHIPSAVNVSAMGLVDPETQTYRNLEELRAEFAKTGALNKERVITYCGGGVAASSDALVLTLLGVRDVAVYDGSMGDWAADPDMPLVTGPDPGEMPRAN